MYPSDIFDWKWYRIPNYNGYEYNFKNKLVRSIKNYKKNPFGKFIKKYCDNSGQFYKMSNMKNEVEKVYLWQIEELIKSDPLSKPIRTECTNMGSRNKLTRKKYLHGKEVESFMPDFSSMIIDENKN